MTAAPHTFIDPSDPSVPHAADPWPADSPTFETILHLYLDPALTIGDIALSLGVSCATLIGLTKHPRFIELLDEFEQASEERAARLARCGLDLAARTFVKVAQSADKPETARKAAGAIVRLHKDASRAPPAALDAGSRRPPETALPQSTADREQAIASAGSNSVTHAGGRGERTPSPAAAGARPVRPPPRPARDTPQRTPRSKEREPAPC